MPGCDAMRDGLSGDEHEQHAGQASAAASTSCSCVASAACASSALGEVCDGDALERHEPRHGSSSSAPATSSAMPIVTVLAKPAIARSEARPLRDASTYRPRCRKRTPL